MQTNTETQEDLSVLLEHTNDEGKVRIKRTNGQVFIIKPESTKLSALDVSGVDLGISTKEIVEFVREGREK